MHQPILYLEFLTPNQIRRYQLQIEDLHELLVKLIQYNGKRIWKLLLLTAMTSIYRIQKWRDIDRAMAPSSHLLDHGGMESKDWFSLKLQMQNIIINNKYAKFYHLWIVYTGNHNYHLQWPWLHLHTKL